MIRPSEYDECVMTSDIVYVSYCKLASNWSLGLIARRDIAPGERIAVYDGTVLSSEESENSTSEYLMTVRSPDDLRRRIVLDGDPRRVPNMCAYANYASHKFANAMFQDETKRGTGPCVVLIAKEYIEEGVEIRVDYDMGNRSYPYRDRLIRDGILDDTVNYKVRWSFPSN